MRTARARSHHEHHNWRSCTLLKAVRSCSHCSASLSGYKCTPTFIHSCSTLEVNGDNCPQMWSICDAIQLLATIYSVNESGSLGGGNSMGIKWCWKTSPLSENRSDVRWGGEFKCFVWGMNWDSWETSKTDCLKDATSCLRMGALILETRFSRYSQRPLNLKVASAQRNDAGVGERGLLHTFLILVG
jgi:hypothetical protein